MLDKFAGYGFNKAHAACYGVITCQTAWLKARHPVEFMAALLSNELDNTDKIELFIGESKMMGIQVLGPNVNESGSVFTVGGKHDSLRSFRDQERRAGGSGTYHRRAQQGRSVPRHAWTFARGSNRAA